MIADVLTASELALLRTRPQRTQLYLAIPEYHTIYTARENGAPADDDNIISVTFDGGVGTLANVLPGMTLLVGSSAGAWDVGIARIRDSALDLGGGTGTFFIGITSEIDWTDDLYLTVIDDYGLWPKHPYVSAVATYMDYGVVYTNQNVYGDPVPIMGTHAVIEAGDTVHFDASSSYNCIGTPNHYDYEWFVDNVSVAITATVDIAFPIVGTYTIRLEVTADYAIGSPVIEKTSVAVAHQSRNGSPNVLFGIHAGFECAARVVFHQIATVMGIGHTPPTVPAQFPIAATQLPTLSVHVPPVSRKDTKPVATPALVATQIISPNPATPRQKPAPLLPAPNAASGVASAAAPFIKYPSARRIVRQFAPSVTHGPPLVSVYISVRAVPGAGGVPESSV